MHLTPTRILGDEHDLSRLLRNLTDNAVRHARSGVHLSLTREGDRAVLVVANDGDPIPVQDRQRIFERFVRLDESRTRDSGGSGLGLAIVREIATSHGGVVEVADTEPGPVKDDRVRFRVSLPVSLVPDED